MVLIPLISCASFTLNLFPSHFSFSSLGRTKYQHFPVFWIGVIRKKNNHTVFLSNSTQPKQIAVLFEVINSITIRGYFIITYKNGNGVFLHLADETVSGFLIKMSLLRGKYFISLRFGWLII